MHQWFSSTNFNSGELPLQSRATNNITWNRKKNKKENLCAYILRITKENNDAEAQGEQQQQKSAAYNKTRETWQIPKRNRSQLGGGCVSERESARECKLITGAWQQQSQSKQHSHILSTRPTFWFYYRAQQSRLLLLFLWGLHFKKRNNNQTLHWPPLSLTLLIHLLFVFNRDTLKVANSLKSTKK